MNCIRFRASSLMAIFFAFHAFNAFSGHNYVGGIFDVVLVLCLIASWWGKPICLGPFNFSGW